MKNLADTPRSAQWVDEDALGGDDPILTGNDLSGMSMGALLRTQKRLPLKNPSDESESDNESESSQNPEDRSLKSEWTTKPRSDIAKRKDKHAPTEVTSKKPVTRRRNIMNVKTPQARDPRFLPMTGELSQQKFQTNYQFLNEFHKTELSTLRSNLHRARKSLVTSPRITRHEREAEVNRLELAVKRAESVVNKDRRDTIEQETLRAAKKQEQQKQQSGKREWFMKDSEKKQLLVRARYDALAEEGGQRAVKKSIEKKRKKMAQKEKKSRPFPKSKHSFEFSNNDAKRRKLE